jgi:lipopolysaccharide/colanic/teichoic acid biosynthesis glycosyltransferase
VRLISHKLLFVMPLVVAAPITLVIATAIAAESPVAVIFKRRRSGQGGRSSVLFKFRFGTPPHWA